MKKFLLPLPVTLALALPAAAAASRYNRNCGSHRDGWVLGPEDANYESEYEVLGPWHINMTQGEAIRLARRAPIQEFGYRIKSREIPCLAGTAIASSASYAWLNWPGDDGWTNVVASTSGGNLRIGRFYCTGRTGRTTNGGVAQKETCTMRYRGGKVVGSLKITDNPNYSGPAA
jgi:hypothetical protein